MVGIKLMTTKSYLHTTGSAQSGDLLGHILLETITTVYKARYEVIVISQLV